VPTLFLIPLLYLVGHLFVNIIVRILPIFEYKNIELISTLLTFILFIVCLPSWIRLRWKRNNYFKALGLSYLHRKDLIIDFSKGFVWSVCLILVVLIPLSLSPWINSFGTINLGIFLNAILLCFGVGFAEELIFRGWLWGELNLILGNRLGVIFQALIYSLVHIRLDLNFIDLISLLFGLFLLGLVLAVRRTLDKGSLSGCIGLHGGLVGIWFCINSGLVGFSENTPTLLVGPGGITPNPLGGLLAIFSLLTLLYFYRVALASAGLPSSGALKASCKGDAP